MRGDWREAPHLRRHHSVYRLFDEAGVLLYVGRTRNFATRLRQHRKPWTEGGSSWSYQFNNLIASWSVEGDLTEAEAERREAAIIAAEAPLYNRWRPTPVPCGPLASRWPNLEKAPHLWFALEPADAG